MSSYYGTVAEANTYFGDKLHEVFWSTSSLADRPKALLAASRIIDGLRFAGSKTVETQDLEFPRDGETIVPEKIEQACYEIAYELLGGFDPQLESESQYVASEGYSAVRVSYFNPGTTRISQPHTDAGIPSKLAYQWLSQFQSEEAGYHTVRVERAS
jgi:hypothetical protein